MSSRFELTFDITQAEIAAAYEAAMRVQPEWDEVRKASQRFVRCLALFGSPVIAILFAYYAGRGTASIGPYVLGACIGLLLSAVIYIQLSHVHGVGTQIEKQARRIRAADLSADAGPKTVVIEEHGFQLTSSSGLFKCSWTNAWPSKVGGFLFISTTTGGLAVIPARAFASEAEATLCHEVAMGWWQAAQLPHAQRLERYLADRDPSCPRCDYPLRALRGEACPECGEPIRLERLTGY